MVVLGALLFTGTARALMISEVMYNPVGGFGSDDGLEWIELYNDDVTTVDLSGFSLGWGGSDYTFGSLQLAGNLAPGEFIVVGGPDPGPGVNWLPDPIDPNLPDGFITAGGVGLFTGTETSGTPIDAVIFASGIGFNFNGLIDETGAVAGVDATIGGAGDSIERISTISWVTNATPSPGVNPAIPEPGTGVLLAAGLGLLAWQRRR